MNLRISSICIVSLAADTCLVGGEGGVTGGKGGVLLAVGPAGPWWLSLVAPPPNRLAFERTWQKKHYWSKPKPLAKKKQPKDTHLPPRWGSDPIRAWDTVSTP